MKISRVHPAEAEQLVQAGEAVKSDGGPAFQGRGWKSRRSAGQPRDLAAPHHGLRDKVLGPRSASGGPVALLSWVGTVKKIREETAASGGTGHLPPSGDFKLT